MPSSSGVPAATNLGLHLHPAQGEVKLLLELLPRYAAHMAKYPHTLLVKFFGLYRVIPDNGAKVCLPV